MNSFLFSAKVVPFVDSRVNRILKLFVFSIYPTLSPAKLARSRARIDKWDKSPAIRASKRGFSLTERSRGPLSQPRGRRTLLRVAVLVEEGNRRYV
jgi:hypothetical protein